MKKRARRPRPLESALGVVENASYLQLDAHRDHCPTCKKSELRRADMCHAGVVLLNLWVQLRDMIRGLQVETLAGPVKEAHA